MTNWQKLEGSSDQASVLRPNKSILGTPITDLRRNREKSQQAYIDWLDKRSPGSKMAETLRADQRDRILMLEALHRAGEELEKRGGNGFTLGRALYVHYQEIKEEVTGNSYQTSYLSGRVIENGIKETHLQRVVRLQSKY